MVEFFTGMLNFGIEYFWLIVDIVWFMVTSPFFQGMIVGSLGMYFSIITDVMENYQVNYFEAIEIIDGNGNVFSFMGDYNEVR